MRSNRDNLAILEATINEIDTFDSTPVYIVRSQEGQILTPGDSGGVVWFDGALIANTWAGISKIPTATTIGDRHSLVRIQTGLSGRSCISGLE